MDTNYRSINQNILFDECNINGKWAIALSLPHNLRGILSDETLSTPT